jgi:transposase
MTKSSARRGKRARRAFSAEFKVEAVRLMGERRAQGVSLTQVGRELDVRPNLLRRWARRLAQRPGAEGRDVFPGNGRQPSAEEELRRLQRENATLRQERDFLKNSRVRRGRPTCWTRNSRVGYSRGHPGAVADRLLVLSRARQKTWSGGDLRT